MAPASPPSSTTATSVRSLLCKHRFVGGHTRVKNFSITCSQRRLPPPAKCWTCRAPPPVSRSPSFLLSIPPNPLMDQEIRPWRRADQVEPLQIQANRVLHGTRGGSRLVLMQTSVHDVDGRPPASRVRQGYAIAAEELRADWLLEQATVLMLKHLASADDDVAGVEGRRRLAVGVVAIASAAADLQSMLFYSCWSPLSPQAGTSAS